MLSFLFWSYNNNCDRETGGEIRSGVAKNWIFLVGGGGGFDRAISRKGVLQSAGIM